MKVSWLKGFDLCFHINFIMLIDIIYRSLVEGNNNSLAGSRYPRTTTSQKYMYSLLHACSLLTTVTNLASTGRLQSHVNLWLLYFTKNPWIMHQQHLMTNIQTCGILIIILSKKKIKKSNP